MQIGTKSLIYGTHSMFIHPFYVFVAWCKLYGFPFDPRIWFAILLHDIGYWGLPNLDGPEGKEHPFFGASIMGHLFGDDWFWFTLTHSRYYAIESGRKPSRLCYADKLAFIIEPKKLYLKRVRWTGEWQEYMQNFPAYVYAKKREELDEEYMNETQLRSLQDYWLSKTRNKTHSWLCDEGCFHAYKYLKHC